MHAPDHVDRLDACDLCGHRLDGRERAWARGSQSLLGTGVALSTVMCRHCHFIFQPERFSPQLLEALYRDDLSFAFVDDPAERDRVAAHLDERRQVISRAMAARGLRHGARVIDVGGGTGECCAHLAADHDVIVADATAAPVADPRMRKVAGLFDEQLEPGSVDVAVLNHVLEHVFSPTRLLESAARALRDGGLLVAEVPFELYTPLLGHKLGDWRHVVYFSRRSLAALLAKTGFQVLQVDLVDGCYGTRRLPVIRASALKKAAAPHAAPALRSSWIGLFADLLAPAALLSLARRLQPR